MSDEKSGIKSVELRAQLRGRIVDGEIRMEDIKFDGQKWHALEPCILLKKFPVTSSDRNLWDFYLDEQERHRWRCVDINGSILFVSSQGYANLEDAESCAARAGWVGDAA